MRKINKVHKFFSLILLFFLTLNSLAMVPAYADSGPYCGGGSNKVYTSVDLGCSHQGNPMADLTFAIIRLLSDGVGIVIVASLVLAGIQYTTAGGDPGAAQKAKTRITSSMTALVIFLFAYALINYVVPGGFLH